MQNNEEPDLVLQQAAEPFAVGRRLQSVRKSRGLSQRELARRADMTNGSLSLIEQGKVSPSLQSLEKIVRAIPMTLLEFFYEQGGVEAPVVREGDCRIISGTGYEVRVNTFNRVGVGASCVLEQSVDAGVACEMDWYDGTGRVLGIVSEGICDLELGGMRYSLSVGDRFHFGVEQRPRFVNVSSMRARAIMVVTPFES